MWFWSPQVKPGNGLPELAQQHCQWSCCWEVADLGHAGDAIVKWGKPRIFQDGVSSGRQTIKIVGMYHIHFIFVVNVASIFHSLSLSILIHAYMVSIYQYSIPILWSKDDNQWCQVPEAFHSHSAAAKVRAPARGRGWNMGNPPDMELFMGSSNHFKSINGGFWWNFHWTLNPLASHWLTKSPRIKMFDINWVDRRFENSSRF